MLNLGCVDEAATERLGGLLWRAFLAASAERGADPGALSSAAPTLVLLRGALGAGKTTLVRGALRAAGLNAAVRSPTFTLVEVYSFGETTVYHWDLYRLHDGASLDALGFRDYLHTGALLFIEWPERCPALFEQHEIEVRLDADGSRRTAVFEPGRLGSGRLLQALTAALARNDSLESI